MTVLDREEVNKVDVRAAQCGNPGAPRRGGDEQMARVDRQEYRNVGNFEAVPEKNLAVLDFGRKNRAVGGRKPAAAVGVQDVPDLLADRKRQLWDAGVKSREVQKGFFVEYLRKGFGSLDVLPRQTPLERLA